MNSSGRVAALRPRPRRPADAPCRARLAFVASARAACLLCGQQVHTFTRSSGRLVFAVCVAVVEHGGVRGAWWFGDTVAFFTLHTYTGRCLRVGDRSPRNGLPRPLCIHS